jgi:hypothetical protein
MSKLLLKAIQNKRLDLITKILDGLVIDPSDASILLSAIKSHDINIVETLVNHGYDLNHH